MTKKSLMKNKKFVIYVKKNLVLIKNTVKSEIIAITQEDLEELLIVFAVYITKYQFIFEVDADYPKNHHKLHSDLPFLPKRMKIEKVKKLVCTVQDKENYVVHIKALKQALNHGLILKKVHRVTQFNQEA